MFKKKPAAEGGWSCPALRLVSAAFACTTARRLSAAWVSKRSSQHGSNVAAAALWRLVASVTLLLCKAPAAATKAKRGVIHNRTDEDFSKFNKVTAKLWVGLAALSDCVGVLRRRVSPEHPRSVCETACGCKCWDLSAEADALATPLRVRARAAAGPRGQRRRKGLLGRYT
jgi:hypothetical protein